MIFDAIEFAVKAHSGKFRKGTKIPYIVHPLGVAKILIEYGCAEEIVTAGILHDTVEDTPVKIEDIQRCFGKEVAFASVLNAFKIPYIAVHDKDTNPIEEKKNAKVLSIVGKADKIVILDPKFERVASLKEGEISHIRHTKTFN